jgi:hypothetical protein
LRWPVEIAGDICDCSEVGLLGIFGFEGLVDVSISVGTVLPCWGCAGSDVTIGGSAITFEVGTLASASDSDDAFDVRLIEPKTTSTTINTT